MLLCSHVALDLVQLRGLEYLLAFFIPVPSLFLVNRPVFTLIGSLLEVWVLLSVTCGWVVGYTAHPSASSSG